jgi:hypothetical protein
MSSCTLQRRESLEMRYSVLADGYILSPMLQRLILAKALHWYLFRSMGSQYENTKTDAASDRTDSVSNVGQVNMFVGITKRNISPQRREVGCKRLRCNGKQVRV